MPTEEKRAPAGFWKRLSAVQRRRIVLGSLVAVSLAARDALLLFAAGVMFALSELTPSPAPASRPA